jgi:hypothetical protein
MKALLLLQLCARPELTYAHTQCEALSSDIVVCKMQCALCVQSVLAVCVLQHVSAIRLQCKQARILALSHKTACGSGKGVLHTCYAN